MKRLCACAVAAVACASTSAWAQPADRIDEIVVTASRIEMPLRSVGASVSVLAADDIRAAGFDGLGDVLRTQPAVAASNSGGAGKPTALRVRGEEGFRTLVLIDGMDVSDPSGTQIGPNVEHILSAGLERVEILRGTHGMMYGADAGGVVSVTTPRAAEGLDGWLGLEGGAYGTQEYSGGLGVGGDRIDAYVGAVRFDTGGFNSGTADTVLRDDDGYENTTIHGRVGFDATDEIRLELVGRQVDGDDEYDTCFTVATFAETDDCRSDYAQTAVRTSAEYRGERFGHLVAYNRTDGDRDFFSEGERGFGGEGDLERLEYVGRFTANEVTGFVYGIERREDAFDDGFTAYQRAQDAVYAEYQGAFGESLHVTAGARYDDNDDFGSRTSYRATAAYLIDFAAGTLKLKSSYGTGFRAPSLYEVSYNASAFGNGVVLREEESAGLDAGFEYFGERGLYLELVYFDQTIEDEIFFDLQTFAGYLQGDGKSSSTGVEVVTEVPLGGGFLLTGNYTYDDTSDSSGEARLRRPEHLANAGLRYESGSSRLRVDLALRLAYDAADGADRADLDDYVVVNLAGRYGLSESLDVFARVENLLDESYSDVAGYRTSGASAYAGLRFEF